VATIAFLQCVLKKSGASLRGFLESPRKISLPSGEQKMMHKSRFGRRISQMWIMLPRARLSRSTQAKSPGNVRITIKRKAIELSENFVSIIIG
jgi:hypothetical protein